MQNPFRDWLQDWTPQNQPSLAQLGNDEDDWLQQWQPPTQQPTAPPQAPGVPVPPPVPMTQSRSPNEYVKTENDAWWKHIPKNVINTVTPSTLKNIVWELIQPVAFYDRPQGTSAFDRPNWLQSLIDEEKQKDPNLTDEQIIENLKNLPEWQFAHKLPEGNFIIAPMLRDMVLYMHGGTQTVRNLFGKYTDKILPDWLNPTISPEDRTALGNELTKKWDFGNPAARQEFQQQMSEGTALLEYGGDFAAGLTLLGRASGTSGTALRGIVNRKTPTAIINQINKKLGLPENAPPFLTQGAIKHHISKHPFARAMDKAGGHLQTVDAFLNEGGLAPGWYSMPTKQVGQLAGRIPGAGGLQRAIQRRIDPKTGRFEMKSGLADIIDPEIWAIRTALGVGKRVGTRALSPFADMVNTRMTRYFQEHGIDPKTLPETLMSRSEQVAQQQGMQLNLDERAITEKLQTALRVMLAQAENIADGIGADGDITKAGKSIEDAFQQFENEFSRWARHYRNTIVPGSEHIVADLTPIFQLRQQMEIERQRLHPSGNVSDEPTMVRYLDDLINTMQRTEQAGLTPEAVEAMRQGQPPPTPLQPEGAAPHNVTIAAVRTENQLGLPYRTASSGDYKQHYNVEYKILPAGKVVLSHTLQGEENPLFKQITEQLGYTNLQPREFKGDFVRSLAADLQPMGYLADMRILDRGAPIVVEIPDVTHIVDGAEVTETVYLMLSGNNRTLALEMARQEYPEQYGRYRTEMEQEIGHYGYVKADITNPDDALFRVLTDKDVDLAQLVDQSNTTAIRLFDAGEQSEKDREHLNQDLLQRLDFNFNGRLGDILQNETNIDVVFEWLKRFTPADRGNMTTTERARTGDQRGSEITTLTEQGVQRLVNALFRRTFDGSYGRKMMELFVTRQDSDIKNIESAVINALQDMSDLEIGTRASPTKYDPQYQLAEDLAQAIVGAWEMIQEGTQQGLNKTDSVQIGRQQGELLTGMARIANEQQQLLLDVIVEAIQTPSVLTNFLQDYVAAVREQGSPEDLFGAGERPPKSVLVEQLHYEYFTPEDATLAETADGYERRLTAEHITSDKLRYEMIRRHGFLTGGHPDYIDSDAQNIVYFSAGASWRTPRSYGFLFQVETLQQKYGGAPDWSNIEAAVESGQMPFTLEEYNDFLEQGELRESQEDSWEFSRRMTHDFLESKGVTTRQVMEASGLSDEIQTRGPIDITDAWAVAEAGEVKVITEATRGKPESEWQYRDLTQAELRDSGLDAFLKDANERSVMLEDDPAYEDLSPIPVSPLQLWHAARRQQSGETLARYRAAQRQQQADDALSEVEQLYLDIEDVEAPDPPTNPLQGLVRRGKRTLRQKLRSIIAPVMNSNRLLSVELEGFLPIDARTDALIELQRIEGIEITGDDSLTPDVSLIEDEEGNRLTEYEDVEGEITDEDLIDAVDFADLDDPETTIEAIQDGTVDEATRSDLENIALDLKTESLQSGATLPPLRGIEVKISKQKIRDMERKLRQVMEVLNKYKARVNKSAGFHVHVDKQNMSAGEMGNVLFAWLKYEWAITQQPGWENAYSKSLTHTDMIEDRDMAFAKEYLAQHGNDINAALRALENDPSAQIKIGANPIITLNRASKWDADVVEMEQRYLSQLQNAMRKGHSVMLGQTSKGHRLNIKGAGVEGETIEFRQGDATLDVEQAMKNVAFALGFVEKFKNRALKPGVRPPLAEALRQVLPTGEETAEAYYQRLLAGETTWDTDAGKSVDLIEKLKEWDADPNIAYMPFADGISYTGNGKPTYKALMHSLPAGTESITVSSGTFNPDGTFKPETSPQVLKAIPVPSAFDTNPLVTFGEIFDPPDIDIRMRKLLVNILDRVTLPLVGMRIDSPRELAVVTQALRANFESTRFFLYDSKNQRITGYKVISMNRTGEAPVIEKEGIAKLIADSDGADSFFMMHNHPGGSAIFSEADVKKAGNYYIRNFGDQFLGQIVIDSGEFAYQWQTSNPHTPEANIRHWDNDPNHTYILHAKDTLDGMSEDDMRSSEMIFQSFFTHLAGAEKDIVDNTPEMQNFKNLLNIDEVGKMRVSVVDRSDPNNIKVVDDDVAQRPRWRIENNVELTEKELGWNPEGYETPQLGQIQIRRNDPRFKGARSREARAYGRGIVYDLKNLVNLAQKFKIDKNWIYIALISSQKRLTGVVEITADELKSFSKDQLHRYLSKAAVEDGATHIFVMIGEGDWYSDPDAAIRHFLKDNSSIPIVPDLIQAISVDNHPNVFQVRRGDPDFIGQKTRMVTEQDLPKPDPSDRLKTLLHRSAPTGVSEPTETYNLKGNAERQRSETGRTRAGRRAEADFAAVQPPVTYGQLEAWRTYMRRSKEQHDVGSPQHVAASRMERALTEAMERSMLGFSPDMWEKLETFYRLYKDGAVSAQSKIAKAIRQNSEVKGVEGTSNYARMAETLFSPGDTPENIGLLYKLIGGFDGEAGKQIRAVFLESLMENSRPKGATLEQEVLQQRTAEARQTLERAQAELTGARSRDAVATAEARLAEAQKALDTTTEESRTMHPIDTVNPAGLGGQLERWLKKAGRGYKRKTLDAILGKEVVDALIDLRDFEQSFARLKAGARGSRTAPWITRWLDNDMRRNGLIRTIETLAFAFTPHGGGITGAGAGAAGLGYAMTGSPLIGAGAGITAFIMAWLGAAGLNAFMKYMNGKPAGQRYLLEGTVVALDHALTRTPVLASPEQAQTHTQRINAEDYAGPRALWELARPARFLPKGDDDED